jgi:hypothetical protein
VTFTVEMPRVRQHPALPLAKGLKANDPADAEAIRTNHRHANDKVVLRAEAVAEGGKARARLTPAADALPLTDATFRPSLVVKAWAVSGERVLLSSRSVAAPKERGG